MGMVTAADIEEGLSTFGRIPIYDIFFDTGQSEVKPESADALKAIAEYLDANETQKVDLDSNHLFPLLFLRFKCLGWLVFSIFLMLRLYVVLLSKDYHLLITI